MTERYCGPMSPPLALVRQFAMETPEAMDRIITAYFLAEPDDPHEFAESAVITLLAQWCERQNAKDAKWALPMHLAALTNAAREARRDN